MLFTKAAKIFVILSVAVLFAKSLLVGPFKFDVFFILAAALCTIVALLRKELIVDWKKLRPIGIAIALGVVATLLGSYISHSLGYPLAWNTIGSEYRILAGCLLIFSEIIILGYDDKAFLRNVAYAFLASFLIVITPYVSVPFIGAITQGSNRFSGLIASDFYPTFMLLPTVLVFHFLVKASPTTRTAARAFFLFVLLSLSIGLIIWSGTRSGWLGLTGAILAYILIASRNARRPFGYFFCLMLVFVSASGVGYYLMPAHAKTDIRNRIGYITTAPATVITMPVAPGQSPVLVPVQADNTVKTIPLIDAVSHNQDRLNLWMQGVSYIKKNVLGYGLNYANIINIDNSHSGVHSFPLELLLTGGIVLFGCVSYLLWLCVRSFVRYQVQNRATDIETVLFAALIGFLICTLFLSSFLIRWFWIDLALLLAWQLHRENHRSLSA